MKSIIPESGKPQDLNFKDIKTQAQAIIAEAWIIDVLTNMRAQLSAQAFNYDDEEGEQWTSRINAAMAKTAQRLAHLREYAMDLRE